MIADIQDEKGVLKMAFTDKSDFIAKKRRGIQEKIDKDSTIIDRAQKMSSNPSESLNMPCLER